MKKTFIFALVLFQLINSLFASEQLIVEPKLKTAKVFINGAQLYYTAELQLKKGVTEVTLTNLAEGMDNNSVTVTGNGNAVILSVVQKYDYLQLPKRDAAIKILEDSLESLNNLMNTKKVENEVLLSEQDLILANKQLGGKEGKVTVSDLQNMAAFYRKRLTEIKNQMYKVDLEIKKMQLVIDRIKKQIEELKNKINQRINQLVVTISAKSDVNFNLYVSYVISNAGWSPYYDIRVPNISSKARLSYKANIWQKSGYDWNNIEIILSTRNPNQSNQKPELQPWFIDFYEPVPILKKAPNTLMERAVTSETEAKINDNLQTMADYTAVAQNQLAVEFSPSLNFSVPSDGKMYTLEVQNNELPADYVYYAAPKLDDNAFLIGSLKEWSNYNLLPGNVNVYFENSFVGKTYLNPLLAKDSLIISLGRDPNIVLSRAVLKDYTESKFLSNRVERTFAYEIKAKNNKMLPIKMLIEDQIPISKKEDIEVKLINASGANFNPETGLLQWYVQLKPGETITKQLIYSITFPKNKIIQNL
ncbi:DUF4139 domain-containing protein [Melioribacteraceae bacterium 4301-Me]|uniref:DUF4139 domain-containing protein n=1 Tax=Pyranulibacter aquaticus TaxID=3163344 RepID=UPI003597E8B1